MSVNYASGLSPYEHKGKCGMKEIFDEPDALERAIGQLVQMISESKNMVVITGAGISTSAGIPDFRGPKGVWTLEEKGETPNIDVTFETAKPTLTHMALVALEHNNILKHLISQNVDGLHMRSGFPINRLAELHGNMFLEQCDLCKTKYIRSKVVPTMARRVTGSKCKVKKHKGTCRGRIRDTILDWEDELPIDELNISDDYCRNSDLCLCLGTSLQIMPCGNMPLLTKKNGGKIVVINLQKTRIDNKCDLKIFAYVDDVMKKVCEKLKIRITSWTSPVINLKSIHTHTIPPLNNNNKSNSSNTNNKKLKSKWLTKNPVEMNSKFIVDDDLICINDDYKIINNTNLIDDVNNEVINVIKNDKLKRKHSDSFSGE